ISAQLGTERAHLVGIEGRSRDHAIIFTSAQQVARARRSLELGDQLVAEPISRDAFEVGVVVSTRAGDLRALERAESLLGDSRDRASHPIRTTNQGCMTLGC